MPIVSRPCGARIHYVVQGSGPIAVLLLAPGGMRSNIHFWDHSPYNPWRSLSGEEFKVIAMDQRNAGQSVGPLSPERGWETFTEDQLAVLDHLGVGQAVLVGSCIGCSYMLKLVHAAPTVHDIAVDECSTT